MSRWLFAFLFTELVECPIYWTALDDRAERSRVPRSRLARLALVFGASAITHPVVWFVIPWLWRELDRPGGYWAMAAAAETFAVVVEGGYLRLFGVRRALWWALVANLTSVTLGLLSRQLFGWP